MVLLINGIPLVAIELKNQIKNQSVENAKNQFMFDRDPDELIFKFNHRILVYFAVDLYEVYMTTHLNKSKTVFLPFNQGSQGAGKVGGKGNPNNPNGYQTAYLWEKILQKDAFLDILDNFINLEEKVEKNDHGKKIIKQKLIFPRFHQYDVVKKLVADTIKNGSGQHYLIQHSAGSGKSNSIAWLAYHLQKIHDQNNQPIFNSIIVITDRKVLDRQLQKTINSFNSHIGLVELIDHSKTSKDLLNAIIDNKQIIVTTLQKFPVIYDSEMIKNYDSQGKRFAIIVDEAHSSQTGISAEKLKSMFADKTAALEEYEAIDADEAVKLSDFSDELNAILLSHGRHQNISFFAFTATPKPNTLQMFGSKTPEGKYVPFHIYSMRQAIEEGFILDVLKNYMTYTTAYNIVKNIPDDPELPKSKAKKLISRFADLHPYNLSQKTQIMIEIFREKIFSKINSKMKAMVVTSSRMAAVRYTKEFRAYIKAKNYHQINVLIAFSGSISVDQEEHTEANMNGFSENQLRDKFA
ncbi:DEAD/DEAH box helicase family protein [[Mycoplasma] cavipharyngis]|uniref:DEAD/DEAH box helicase family protein n=1 Tax=[Mycoplasma] cavipharyngis TaxID=92757 RepID=UPI0037042F59